MKIQGTLKKKLLWSLHFLPSVFTTSSYSSSSVTEEEEEEIEGEEEFGRRVSEVMTTIRRFCCNDFLRLASVNLDHFTITVGMPFFMRQLVKWPDYSMVALAPGNRMMGYLTGETKGKGDEWYGFVSGLTIGSEYRRRGLASKLMRMFESELLEKMLFCPSDLSYFVNLYVGISNKPAINMFTKLGYRLFARMPEFYSEDEDAYDMRKKLVLGESWPFYS